MTIKCVIIDDEPLAVDLLNKYAAQTPFLKVVGTFTNALTAIQTIENEGVDLVFLDINMPLINGLEFSKTLKADVKVIFTTAYDTYAIESFRLNALDYLLKPIKYAHFLEASQRALDWFKIVHSKQHLQTSIFIKSGYRVEKLEFASILYIESRKDYVLFHIEGEKEPISSLMKLQSAEEKLPSEIFMRTHRSFIVNLQKINTVERNTILFGKRFVPVSESYRDAFNKFLESRLI